MSKTQKKQRASAKLNFMSLEPETPVVLPSLLDPTKYDNAQVLIKQTRRNNYIIFLPIFLNTVKLAIKEGRYIIKPNEWATGLVGNRELIKKKSADKTIHSNPYNILVNLDVVYGASLDHCLKNVSVDICGACINAAGDLAINADPEVMIWVERVIQLHKNTHYICVTNGCYFTFDKTLIYGTSFTCPVCRVEQCPKCKTTWEPHKDISCELFSIGANITNISDSYILEQLYLGNIQPCPKCYTLTHKTAGCSKIICESPHCGEYWCWGCGQGELRTKYDNPYDHWYKKCCVVFTGLFAEDEASAKIIRDAIAARNLRTFGKRIIPK